MTTNQLAYQQMQVNKDLKTQELAQLKDLQQSQINYNEAKTALAELEKLVAEYEAEKLQYKGGGTAGFEVVLDWVERFANVFKPFASSLGKQYNTGNRNLFE